MKDEPKNNVDITEYEEAIFDITTCLLKNVEPKQGHWINGDEYDQGEDWCPDCGAEKVAELNKKNKKGNQDYILDGGWENHNSDISAHCEGCGCLLNYWPTEECAEQEIEGFEERGEITNDMCEEDLYSLSVCCQAAQSFDSQELRERLAKICMKFLQWYWFNGRHSEEMAK
jgi:hypothetical protein